MIHLKEYIVKTKALRKGSQLFIGYVKPHVPVPRQTFSCWVKSALAGTGVDTDKYSSHSTHAESCSAAAKWGVCLQTILKAAGWTNE